MSLFTIKPGKTDNKSTKTTGSFGKAVLLSAGLMGCYSAQDVAENCSGNGQNPSQYGDNATGCVKGPNSISNTDMTNVPSIDQKPNDNVDMKGGNVDMGSFCNLTAVDPKVTVTFDNIGTPGSVISKDSDGNSLGGFELRRVSEGVEGTNFNVDFQIGCFGAPMGSRDRYIGDLPPAHLAVHYPTNNDGSGTVNLRTVSNPNARRDMTFKLNLISKDGKGVLTGTLEVK